MAEMSFYKEERPTIWQRLGFGSCGTPNMDDLEDAKGFVAAYLVTGTIVVFDWRDRLRVLVSGKIEVVAATKTDVIVSKTLSRSKVSVLPPDYPPASDSAPGEKS